MAHVFAYGSLLLPESLARTLPGVDPDDCVPARCRGRRRTFGVAFPNGGSQPDKAYLDADGRRPAHVLFATLVPTGVGPVDGVGVVDGARAVNGACIPVCADDLAALRDRERRYSLVDVTARVRPYPGHRPLHGPVLAFVGRPQFTRPEDVAAGVAPHEYVESIERGAVHWEGRCAGFLADFAASTEPPAAVAALIRVDLAARPGAPAG